MHIKTELHFLIQNEGRAISKEIKTMHTKCMGLDDMISSLSGGNQQKVIRKMVGERSKHLLMDELTRGITLVQNMRFGELIINMAKTRKTVIVVSSRNALRFWNYKTESGV